MDKNAQKTNHQMQEEKPEKENPLLTVKTAEPLTEIRYFQYVPFQKTIETKYEDENEYESEE